MSQFPDGYMTVRLPRAIEMDPRFPINKLSKTLNFERASARRRMSGSAVMRLLVMRVGREEPAGGILDFRKKTISPLLLAPGGAYMRTW